MTIRATVLPAALGLVLLAGCSKTEEAKQAPASEPPAAAAPAPEPLQSGSLIKDGETQPIDAAARRARESQLELRAAAAEASARLAEIELQERNRQELERQQLAARAEAARAAVLAEEARRLDADNAALRARAYENEQRAIEAERAAYGSFGNSANVIIVQPPQRPGWYGRPRPPHHEPPRQEPPPKGVGISVGLRPAVPDLTPPGPPATFQFDTMRARKQRDAQGTGETPN